MLQEVEEKLYPLATLFTVSIILLIVLGTSQFPAFAENEAATLASSLLVCGSLAAATLLLAGRHAPLPLFALLLALHTMMPVSRPVSMGLAAVITAAHLALSIAHKFNDEKMLYTQVIWNYFADFAWFLLPGSFIIVIFRLSLMIFFLNITLRGYLKVKGYGEKCTKFDDYK